MEIATQTFSTPASEEPWCDKLMILETGKELVGIALQKDNESVTAVDFLTWSVTD
jgi:hypothetical protein